MVLAQKAQADNHKLCLPVEASYGNLRKIIPFSALEHGMKDELPENDPLRKYLDPEGAAKKDENVRIEAINFNENKKEVSSSTYQWIAVLVGLLVLFGFGAFFYPIMTAQRSNRLVVQQITPDEKATNKSDLARSSIRAGMPIYDVLRKMGKPKWAVLPKDEGPHRLADDYIGLELYWPNPGCRTIYVTFGPPPFHVIGWDDGAGECDENVPPLDDTLYSCKKQDRAVFCQ